MTIEEMCIKEGLYFRDTLVGNYYCRLCYSERKVICKYLGKRDENDLVPCEYDTLHQMRDGMEKHQQN